MVGKLTNPKLRFQGSWISRQKVTITLLNQAVSSRFTQVSDRFWQTNLPHLHGISKDCRQRCQTYHNGRFERDAVPKHMGWFGWVPNFAKMCVPLGPKFDSGVMNIFILHSKMIEPVAVPSGQSTQKRQHCLCWVHHPARRHTLHLRAAARSENRRTHLFQGPSQSPYGNRGTMV